MKTTTALAGRARREEGVLVHLEREVAKDEADAAPFVLLHDAAQARLQAAARGALEVAELFERDARRVGAARAVLEARDVRAHHRAG